VRTLEQQQKKLQQKRAEKEFGVLSVRTLKNKAGMKKNTRMATRTQKNKAANPPTAEKTHGQSVKSSNIHHTNGSFLGSLPPAHQHANITTTNLRHAFGVEVSWIFLGNRQLGFERVPQRQPEHKHQQMHACEYNMMTTLTPHTHDHDQTSTLDSFCCRSDE
jgi:hypothetical protein